MLLDQPRTNNTRGELGTGTWTIVVKDTNVNEFSGRFVDWHLKLWGESLDASKAQLLPMPTEEDDNDHAVVPTTTLKGSTTSVPLPDATNHRPGDADTTDHPNRPVNSKPTGTGTPVPPEAEESATAPASTDKPSTWLPSFLPTFGVSAATQAWIYGSIVLIVLFCAGLGVYLYLARRKRLRNNPRNDYEFELLDDDEDDDFDGGEGLAASGRGARGFEGGGAEKFGAGAGAGAAGAGAAAGGRKGKKRTRGGELYDAFAGDSSDEDGLTGGGDDDNDFGGGRGAVGGGGHGGGQYRDGSSGSDGSGSPIRLSEKLPAPGTGASRRRDSDEEEDEHHVVGDSDEDDDDEDGEESSDEERARRPLHGGSR